MTGRRGFSLVELMVALSVLAVLAGIGVPYLLSRLPTYRVDAAVRQIVGDFRLAKATALERGVDVLIQFHSPLPHHYVLALDTDPDPPDHLITADDQPLKTVDLRGLYEGVQLASAVEQADGVTFVFHSVDDLAQFSPRGTSNGGSVYLRPETRPGEERRVTVLSTTGRVRAYRWNPATSSWD